MSRTSYRQARSRRAICATLAALFALALPVAPAIGDTPIPGLRVESGETLRDTRVVKGLSEGCDDSYAIGGGVKINDGGRKRVRITKIRPEIGGWPNYSGYFWFEAEAMGREEFDWSMRVYTVCAPRSSLAGYTIKTGIAYNGSSQRFESVEAPCPSGKVAWGSGAEVRVPNGPSGEVGLQLMRTDGAMGISRATARESTTGLSGAWQLNSFAICAQPRVYVLPPGWGAPILTDSGIHTEYSAPGTTVATDRCDDAAAYTHGLGGGAGTTDSGPVWLYDIEPHYDLKGVTVRMTGTPTTGVVAQQSCAG
jgi:hypothetical protein